MTPSLFAFRSNLSAIRGDLIWLKSMPVGVYVNGFLSCFIIAFCTHDGISDCGCVGNRLDGTDDPLIGGGGGAQLRRKEQKIRTV